MAGDAALQLQGGINVTGESLSISGYGIGSTGALRSLSGDNTWGGPVTIATASSLIGVDTGTLTIPGPISGANFHKDGNGTLILTGPNTYGGGGASDVRGGVLILRDSGALGTSGYAHVSSGRTLEVQDDITIANGLYIGNGNTSMSTVNLRSTSGDNTWSGYVRLHVSHPYAIIGVDAGSTLTITGPIQRHTTSTVGSLTKVGNGELVITGTSNTYTGPTYVNEGTLRVDGSIASSTLTTVEAAGVLTGSGTVGDLDLFGSLSPGDSPGTIYAGDTTWNGGGTTSGKSTTPTARPGPIPAGTCWP